MENLNTSNVELDNERKRLELEKQRFEIEKLKLEIEKQKLSINQNTQQKVTSNNSDANQQLKQGATFVVNNLLVFLGLIVIYLIVFYMFIHGGSKSALVFGIVLSLALGYVCFFKNKVRSLLTIWWGLVCVLNICWWSYLLTKF